MLDSKKKYIFRFRAPRELVLILTYRISLAFLGLRGRQTILWKGLSP